MLLGRVEKQLQKELAILVSSVVILTVLIVKIQWKYINRNEYNFAKWFSIWTTTFLSEIRWEKLLLY